MTDKFEVDFCEECENRFLGLDGSTKWCPYCGAKHEGETESITAAKLQEILAKTHQQK